MKIKSVTFDEATEPETLTVVMSVDEASLIYGLVGHIAPADVPDGPDRLALSTIAECLSDTFFNIYWEGGHREVGHDVAGHLRARWDEKAMER